MSTPTAKRRPAWKDWKVWLGFAVTAALLYYAAPKDAESWAAMRAAFATADYRWLPVFVGLLAAFYAIKAWRWTLLLRPLGDFSVAKVTPSLMTGFAFNNVLPAHAGEFVRTLMFARQAERPRIGVASTVALEKLFDLIAITLFLAYGLLNLEGLGPQVRTTGVVLAAVTGLGVIGAGAYVFMTDFVLRTLKVVLGKLPVPEGIAAKVIELAELGARGLSSVRSPGLLAGILSSSLLQWVLNGLLAWISLRAFGLEASLPLAATLLGVVAFAVLVPSSPGYFGVIQAAFWLVLEPIPAFADQQPTVFAASVFYHLAQYVPVTVVGMACFLASGVRMTDLLSRDATAADESADAPDLATAAAAEVVSPAAPRTDGDDRLH